MNTDKQTWQILRQKLSDEFIGNWDLGLTDREEDNFLNKIIELVKESISQADTPNKSQPKGDEVKEDELWDEVKNQIAKCLNSFDAKDLPDVIEELKSQFHLTRKSSGKEAAQESK